MEINSNATILIITSTFCVLELTLQPDAKSAVKSNCVDARRANSMAERVSVTRLWIGVRARWTRGHGSMKVVIYLEKMTKKIATSLTNTLGSPGCRYVSTADKKKLQLNAESGIDKNRHCILTLLSSVWMSNSDSSNTTRHVSLTKVWTRVWLEVRLRKRDELTFFSRWQFW